MKKVSKVLCVLLAAIVVLTSCTGGGKNETEQTKVNEGQNQQTQKEEGKKFDGIKLVYWSSWEATEPQGIVIKEIVEAYEQETGVEVKLEFKGRKGIKEGLIPALDAEQQVDLFEGQGNKSNYGERIISLEELVKKYDYEKRTNPVLMDLARSYTNGELKEIPYQFKTNAYLYNKKLFRQVGIEKVPENWKEFLEVCQKLKDAGVIPLTTDDAYAPQAFGMHLARLLGSAGVTDVVRNNGWKKEEVLKAAKAFEELAEKGYFSDKVGSNVWPTGQNTEFATGKAAMYCVGTYLVNEVKNITGPDFEWGYFNYPEVEGGINGKEAMVLGASGFAITSKCQNPDVAFGLIEKITRGEGDAKLAKESLGLPADLENTSWPEQLMDVKSYFDNCKEIFATSGGAENNPEITPAMKENLMKLYAGKITAEEFVDNMEKAAQ